jgi:hypothetical protein
MRSILAGIATSFKLTYFKVVLNFSAWNKFAFEKSLKWTVNKLES